MAVRRFVDAGELRRQRLQAVERRQIAEELSGQLLLLGDRLGDPVATRVLGKAAPGTPPRACQVDRGDLAVGRRRTHPLELGDRAHFAPPKRGFSDSSPVLNSVATIVRTTIVG